MKTESDILKDLNREFEKVSNSREEQLEFLKSNLEHNVSFNSDVEKFWRAELIQMFRLNDRYTTLNNILK